MASASCRNLIKKPLATFERELTVEHLQGLDLKLCASKLSSKPFTVSLCSNDKGIIPRRIVVNCSKKVGPGTTLPLALNYQSSILASVQYVITSSRFRFETLRDLKPH